MVGGCHKIRSILSLLVRAPGGGHNFEKSLITITPSTPTRLTLEIMAPEGGLISSIYIYLVENDKKYLVKIP